MTENMNNGCSQRDSAEHEGYAKASRSFNRIWKERDSAQPKLLEAILYKDNLNRAYKRVKANKGKPGVDGMTVEEALPYLREHQKELTDRILKGKYTPSPVRRVGIPKPEGGVRKLGIPTVIDRTIQQAIAQQLIPIYEPLFIETSYGYRPNKSAKDAILKVKEYAGKGYTYAVSLDLSKYFDTLNHELLINLLRKNVEDERVVRLIKRYLKSGVMESDVVMDTEEGSPQGGNLSPLLANIYLNEFDQEFSKRGVPCIRYADDIVLLARSKRASERLLESSTKYLEEKLKLTVNREKSRTVSVFAIQNFKFLGFALGRNGSGIYVRVHPKSWKKFKSKLKTLSSRKKCQSIKPSLEKIKVYARGWLNYYGIASMKNNIEDINGWLYHRIRMCIWKQWKKPKTKVRNLLKMGVPMELAWQAGNSRRGYWFTTHTVDINMAMTKERLINSGFYDLATAYQSVHINY
ncbi:MAG: group II intron reverse transcriptase/maturase [Lachnospiraceae bacterium]|nr:group II intron reverse transcriptase/maturase [Lachnospiraceae bacterium]